MHDKYIGNSDDKIIEHIDQFLSQHLSQRYHKEYARGTPPTPLLELNTKMKMFKLGIAAELRGELVSCPGYQVKETLGGVSANKSEVWSQISHHVKSRQGLQSILNPGGVGQHREEQVQCCQCASLEVATVDGLQSFLEIQVSPSMTDFLNCRSRSENLTYCLEYVNSDESTVPAVATGETATFGVIVEGAWIKVNGVPMSFWHAVVILLVTAW